VPACTAVVRGFQSFVIIFLHDVALWPKMGWPRKSPRTHGQAKGGFILTF
jgi:hypothetical protein